MKFLLDYKNLFVSILGCLLISSGFYFSDISHLEFGLVLLIMSVLIYIFSSLYLYNKNWLDLRAVFSGIWIFTIGLASLRLTDYQKVWEDKTWLLLGIAYLFFISGTTVGVNLAKKDYDSLRKKISRLFNGRIYFKNNSKYLYYICVSITLIGLICFVINIAIKGFVPAFSNDIFAYVSFYTKFHLFAVAATAVSGLCYFCIKTQPLSIVKKIILGLCILYLTIIFPVLIVSRGVFIISAFSLSTVIFYLNKQKLTFLICSLVVMAGVYLFTSNLRGYTNEYLNNVFQPAQIEISDGINDVLIPENNSEVIDSKAENIFSLSPKAAFLYGYLTCSHDNFNEAVLNSKNYTFGVRQLKAFNVILRNKRINEILKSSEFYQITPNLTTVNMIGLFYYDFHELGVICCTFIWSLIFGFIQGLYQKNKNIYILLILGYVTSVVALSFFSPWIDSFDIWMLIGVIVLIFLFTSLKLGLSEEVASK